MEGYLYQNYMKLSVMTSPKIEISPKMEGS